MIAEGAKRKFVLSVQDFYFLLNWLSKSQPIFFSRGLEGESVFMVDPKAIITLRYMTHCPSHDVCMV